MGRKKKEISESDIVNHSYIRRAGELFKELRPVGCDRDRARNRQLCFDDYCSWILFYALVPAVDSMRMLQMASDLESVRKSLSLPRFSLGSFSEAPAVFHADKLEPIAARLAARITPQAQDPKLKELKYSVTLVDSTLLRTLPRLTETFYGPSRDGGTYHAWRVHMELQVGLPAPDRTTVTEAWKGGHERKVLNRNLRPGCCYVTDRGFHDVDLYNHIHSKGSRYVCRVRDNLKHTVAQELPVSDEQRKAGILSDQIVLIGQDRKEPPNHPVRLVTVSAEAHPKRTRQGVQPSSGKMLLVANLGTDEAAAEVVSLLYRYRWSIELFFRFLKQSMGMGHLLSHRKEAVRIHVYCMVICCLLLHLWTGLMPNKATLTMVGWYLTGLASLKELLAFVEKQNNPRKKKPV